jgi:amino acid transporter
MSASREPHNPFYLLLLLAGLVFTITVLAYAVIPVLEQKATEAGEPPPPSPFRDALRANGGQWALYELAVVAVFAVASMGLDRLRTLQKERSGGTIPNVQPDDQSPS